MIDQIYLHDKSINCLCRTNLGKMYVCWITEKVNITLLNGNHFKWYLKRMDLVNKFLSLVYWSPRWCCHCGKQLRLKWRLLNWAARNVANTLKKEMAAGSFLPTAQAQVCCHQSTKTMALKLVSSSYWFASTGLSSFFRRLLI